MDDYGILTLLPAVLTIVFALVTKRVFEALVIGIVAAFAISEGTNCISATLNAFQSVAADNVWMILVFGLLGGFTYLAQAAKGPYGFGRFVRKFAKGEASTLIVGWILGIVIFMDDYLNILTCSTSLRDTCDKHKTPREMLAYVIDSTGAPVCVLVPLSTWAVFYASVIEEQAEMASYGSGMSIYLQSMPFILYGWVAVVVVPLVILGVVPKMFGMKKAYQRVKETGKVFSDASEPLNKGYTEFDEIMELEGLQDKKASGNSLDFLLPLALVIAITIWSGDLLLGLAFGIILMIFMYLPRKKLTLEVFCETFAEGFASMVPMMFITIGALTVKEAMQSIDLFNYIIDGVLPFMNANLFAGITFIVVAGLAFITGSNWGVPALTVPILIPLAIAGGANPLVVFGAIVSGGTFGSHVCFYSDSTALTSQCSGIQNTEHAFTQFPYGVLCALISEIGFIICGFVF